MYHLSFIIVHFKKCCNNEHCLIQFHQQATDSFYIHEDILETVSDQTTSKNKEVQEFVLMQHLFHCWSSYSDKI